MIKSLSFWLIYTFTHSIDTGWKNSRFDGGEFEWIWQVLGFEEKNYGFRIRFGPHTLTNLSPIQAYCMHEILINPSLKMASNTSCGCPDNIGNELR